MLETFTTTHEGNDLSMFFWPPESSPDELPGRFCVLMTNIIIKGFKNTRSTSLGCYQEEDRVSAT